MMCNITFLYNLSCILYLLSSTFILLQPQYIREQFHHLNMRERINKNIRCIRHSSVKINIVEFFHLCTLLVFLFYFCDFQKNEKNKPMKIPSPPTQTSQNLSQPVKFTTTTTSNHHHHHQLKMKNKTSHSPP